MQTCRCCKSEDIPDGATHCRHFGKKLRPTDFGKLLAVVILCSIITLILWAFLSQFYDYTQQQEAHARAVQLVGPLSSWCNPETPADLVDVMEEEVRNELHRVDPNPDDQTMLETALQNKLEALGCGPNARRQIRSKGTRPHGQR